MTYSFFSFICAEGLPGKEGFLERSSLFSYWFTQLLNMRACFRCRTQKCLRASAPSCQGCRQVLNHQMLPSRSLEQEGDIPAGGDIRG